MIPAMNIGANFESPTPLAAIDKRDWIAGLEKGLSIIETFDDANPRLTATQAGQRCGLTRTAARRYLLTLWHLGYVATDGKLFWLTPRVMRLEPVGLTLPPSRPYPPQ